MRIKKISENVFLVKNIDDVGGTLTTKIILDQLAGIYRASSFYIKDEEGIIAGYAESISAEEAIRFSQDDLRENWKGYLQYCQESK